MRNSLALRISSSSACKFGFTADSFRMQLITGTETGCGLPHTVAHIQPTSGQPDQSFMFPTSCGGLRNSSNSINHCPEKPISSQWSLSCALNWPPPNLDTFQWRLKLLQTT